MTHDSVIHVRVEPDTEKKLDELVKGKRQVRSVIVRQALEEYYAREQSLEELKKIVARKFAEGQILFDDLVRILGYEEAKKVAFFVSMTRKSFEQGLG